jgi:hypothetical protein
MNFPTILPQLTLQYWFCRRKAHAYVCARQGKTARTFSWLGSRGLTKKGKKNSFLQNVIKYTPTIRAKINV